MALALFVAADAFTPGVHAPAVRRSAVAPVAQPVMMVSTLGKKEPVSMRAPSPHPQGIASPCNSGCGRDFWPATHCPGLTRRARTHAADARVGRKARLIRLVQLSHAHAKLLCLSP